MTCSILFITSPLSITHAPRVRESRSWNPENFCSSNPESRVLGFKIGNTPWGMRNPTSDWKFHQQQQQKKKQNPVPGILSWIRLRRLNGTSTFFSAHSTALFAVNCHVSRISSAFTFPSPRCTHDMAIFAAAATYKCKHDFCFVSARALACIATVSFQVNARKLEREQKIEQRGVGGTGKKVSPSPLPFLPTSIISPSL